MKEIFFEKTQRRPMNSHKIVTAKGTCANVIKGFKEPSLQNLQKKYAMIKELLEVAIIE